MVIASVVELPACARREPSRFNKIVHLTPPVLACARTLLSDFGLRRVVDEPFIILDYFVVKVD
jgi:hypothetical protein